MSPTRTVNRTSTSPAAHRNTGSSFVMVLRANSRAALTVMSFIKNPFRSLRAAVSFNAEMNAAKILVWRACFRVPALVVLIHVLKCSKSWHRCLGSVMAGKISPKRRTAQSRSAT